MKRNKTTNEQNIKRLVFEYEAMSQQGTVGFYENAAFVQLVEHYLNQEHYNKAHEVIEHAIHQHPFSGTFYIIRAQLYIEQKREHFALEALDKAMLYASSVFEVQILRAEALSSLGDFDGAFEILDDLLSNSDREQKSEIYLSQALIFESTKQYDQTFIALKKAVFTNPENTDALERVWFSVEMTQQYDESIKFHQELIDINPYSFIAWYNLGYAFSAKDDHENARDAFEYAFIINDQFEFAYRECAESCIQLKDYKKALKCYNELLEHFDPDADIFMKLGLCYKAFGNTEKAKSFFLRARALDENNDEIYFHLGFCFLKENKFEASIAAFEKAITIDALKEEYYIALAQVYQKTNQSVVAQRFYQKATEVAPETSKCWIHFASFLLQTGKTKKALNLLDEAELYAFGVELMYCKTACLFSLDNRHEAFDLLQKALMISYKKHNCLFEVAPALKVDADIQNLISAFSLKEN